MCDPTCNQQITIESSLPDPGVTNVKGFPVVRGDSMWLKRVPLEERSMLCTKHVPVWDMLPADFVITAKDPDGHLVGACVAFIKETSMYINGLCSKTACPETTRLGTQLINLVEDIGKQLGKTSITLTTVPRAQGFQVKKGFKITENHSSGQNSMMRPIPSGGGGRRLRLKTLRKSHNKAKKWDAVFETPSGATKTVPFGQKGQSDQTKHKDKTRRQRQIDRHSGMGENWNDPTTPGALSRYILWNKPTLKGSLRDFKKRFHV